jgi:hypothetical protein
MPVELKVRRARRDDFERVRTLLAPGTPAARADRKRFRRLVTTLREDLYLVEREDDRALVGMALIAYARGLQHPTAVIRQLHGASDAASLLVDCARARALARGCTRLELQLDDDAAPTIADRLAADGWTAGPRMLVQALRAQTPLEGDA